MEEIRKDLERAFANNRDQILSGQYMPLVVNGFRNYVKSTFDNGEKIVSLLLSSTKESEVPAECRFIDIFFLPAGEELGAHLHEKATAQIAVMQGSGKALIGDEVIPFETGDTLTFPKGVVHNVLAHEGEELVFISFQDSPIPQEDGTFDFKTVKNAKKLTA